MKKIKLSIVIVGYKNSEVLINCLNSILKFNDIGDALEIIVVDNSPSKEYIYYNISKLYKNIKIIKNENKGFGQGNNVGVNESKGEFLLFLNPDTILIEPIFKYSIRKFEEDEYLVLFGLKLLDKELKSNSSYFFRYRFGIVHSQLLKILQKKDIYIAKKMFISGANIFVRRKQFLEAGMFDPKIFMYGEEADLINRLENLNKNYKTAYFKEKRIIHLEGKSSEVKEKSIEERIKSSIYYGKKYNKDYNKKLKSELRYLQLKYYIYIIINDNKSYELKKIIKIYKRYIKR